MDRPPTGSFRALTPSRTDLPAVNARPPGLGVGAPDAPRRAGPPSTPPSLHPPAPALDADAGGIPEELWAEAMAEAMAKSGSLAPSSPDEVAPRTTPWDEGPAETSAVTLEADPEQWGDAVAERTPLPVLDREPVIRGGWTPGDLWQPSPMNAGYPSAQPSRAAAPPPPAKAPAWSPERPISPILSAVAQPRDPSLSNASPEALLAAAKSRLGQRDLDGALELLERIPAGYGLDDARRLLDQTRQGLERIYEAKIGVFHAAPRVLLSNQELIWLNLNHRAGYVLSQIDGKVSFEDLIALSGMPRLDTLRILCTLKEEHVIG
jgi:hypothetical protein